MMRGFQIAGMGNRVAPIRDNPDGTTPSNYTQDSRARPRESSDRRQEFHGQSSSGCTSRQKTSPRKITIAKFFIFQVPY